MTERNLCLEFLKQRLEFRLGANIIIGAALWIYSCSPSQNNTSEKPVEQLHVKKKKEATNENATSEVQLSEAIQLDKPKNSPVDTISNLIEAQRKGVLTSFIVCVVSYHLEPGRSPRRGSGTKAKQHYGTMLQILDPEEMAGHAFNVVHVTPPPENNAFRNIGGIYRVRFNQNFVELFSKRKFSSIGAGALEILGSGTN